MLVFAPAISRTLESFPPPLELGAWCTGLSPSLHQPSLHHLDTSGDPTPLPTDDACGYCTLMYHSPVLTADVLLRVPPLPAASLVIVFQRMHSPRFAPLDQRSRGPPVV